MLKAKHPLTPEFLCDAAVSACGVHQNMSVQAFMADLLVTYIAASTARLHSLHAYLILLEVPELTKRKDKTTELMSQGPQLSHQLLAVSPMQICRHMSCFLA